MTAGGNDRAHPRRSQRRAGRLPPVVSSPLAWACVLSLFALPAAAGPLEQRFGDRLQAHGASLVDAATRRECLADLLAFRERHGLRPAGRRAADEAASRRTGDEPAVTPTATTAGPGATASPALPAALRGADGSAAPAVRSHTRSTAVTITLVPAATATGTPPGTAGALPPVAPILPLRVVQRRPVGIEQFVYRLSDGSVWEDVEGARSRLREGALVRIAASRFSAAHFMVSSNERRRVRALGCGNAAPSREAAHCRLLRDGALTF